MANPIPNLWRVPELKDKILFTLLMLLIYRFGAHITVPGLDVGALREQFGQLQDLYHFRGVATGRIGHCYAIGAGR